MKLLKKCYYHFFRFIGSQDWLRYGIRRHILQLFVNINKVDSYAFEVDFFDLKYNGNINRYIDWHVFFEGAYEKTDLFLLRDSIKETAEPIFLDIGANVGMHSIYMSKFCKEIHAFEPFPPVLEQFKDKIARNNIGNITLHEIALGDEDKELPFYAPVGRNVGTGSFVATHEQENNRPFGKIRVFKGDEYIENWGGGLDGIDLIKIDVEGFEKDVLIGLRKTLEKYRPIIVMEYHTSTYEAFEDFQEFESIVPENYEFYKIDSNITAALFFNRPIYRLSPFDFNKPGFYNILLKPS